MSDATGFLVTCEHGGNRVPARYARHCAGQEGLLASHRGWDPGALSLARAFAHRHSAPLRFSRVSRLLVELNRSPGHPHLFSSLTRRLSQEEKEEILRRWYRPYRDRVTMALETAISTSGVVLHLSVHTFTPVLKGRERQVEIGLLYDPARGGEASLCHAWRRELEIRFSAVSLPIRVRFNQPYQGRSDGFTTWLRRRFPADRYLGIELEVNQGLIRKGGLPWRVTREALLETLPLPQGRAGADTRAPVGSNLRGAP